MSKSTLLNPLFRLPGKHFAEIIIMVIPWWVHKGTHSVSFDALRERGYDGLLLVDGQHIENCSIVAQYSDDDVAILGIYPYTAAAAIRPELILSYDDGDE